MITAILQRFRRFGKNEDGPTAVEYAVMLALIIAVVVFSVRVIGRRSNRTFGRTARVLDTTAGGGGGFLGGTSGGDG